MGKKTTTKVAVVATTAKEISFTATIRFNGRIDVDMADVADFSISDALGDVYVDINNGDVVIDDYDLEDVSEQY